MSRATPATGGTLVYWHPLCSQHDTGSGHPERAARMQAVLDALGAPEFAALRWREAPAASFDQLERVHPAQHVDRLMSRMPAWGQAMLDGDTIVSPGSFEAALRAAGAVCAAIDAVVAGEARNAFCAIRPPGHHAEAARAMGFCLFNNVAIGAAHARSVHGIERIAIVDFDVHHGNGTQAIFETVPQVLYVSTHQYPLYPGTGHPEDTGVAANVLNVPLRAGAGGEALRRAWTDDILPALRRHEPGLLLVSAGFDAHRDDPLAELRFTDEDYHWLGEQLAGFAAECCGGRLVSVLEGGYELSALASSSAAHVRALLAAGV